jgi:RNA polymerase sigma-70 factor (ECF subfamily)
MDDERDIIAAWITREILPHEGALHSWLRRRWRNLVDPNEVIQETYCRIAGLASVDHINNPVGYFYRTAHAAATDMLRRGNINFVPLTENEWSNVIDAGPLVDRVMGAEQELKRVNGLLSKLSDTCRRAIELRRMEGVSQREAARQLGVSEDVIRNHLVRGIRKVLKAMADQDEDMSNGEQRTMGKEARIIGKPRS